MASEVEVRDWREIQQILKNIGFDPGRIDGVRGPRTNAAIVAFKASVGLRRRPFFGPITYKALMDSSHGILPDRAPELPWVAELRRMVGLHETRDNAELRAWLRSDGATLGDPSEFPWCGDAIKTSMTLALPDEPYEPPLSVNPYWARNWKYFGRSCVPCYGAVAWITRPGGGGHVCYVVGQDQTRYYCLGGNQRNMICVVPIMKTRFIPESWRWPLTWPVVEQRPIPYMTSDEAASINEA